MEKSQKTRQKANRWSWGGTLQTNTPCTTAGTLTYIIYITQYLLTHSTTHHRHSQLYSHFFPLCIGAHTPDACLCQCLSCINMSACLCVSVLFCHVYIWTFQIRCPLLLLRIHTLLCLSLFLSPPLALKFKLSLSPWLTLSLSLPLSARSLPALHSLFSLPLSFPLLAQVLSSQLSSIHSTLLDWSTCRVLSVSTTDTEWHPNVNIKALCGLAGWR